MAHADPLPRIIAGYLEAAAWANGPEDGTGEFTDEARKHAAAVCAAFVAYVGPELTAQALDLQTPEQFGRDFWLTRTGSGVGYWDRTALDVPPVTVPTLQDRNARPVRLTGPDARSLGAVLSAAAYGTDRAIGPFAYPDLQDDGGALTFCDSAAYALTGGPNVWEFWQQWTATRGVQL